MMMIVRMMMKGTHSTPDMVGFPATTTSKHPKLIFGFSVGYFFVLDIRFVSQFVIQVILSVGEF